MLKVLSMTSNKKKKPFRAAIIILKESRVITKCMKNQKKNNKNIRDLIEIVYR